MTRIIEKIRFVIICPFSNKKSVVTNILFFSIITIKLALCQQKSRVSNAKFVLLEAIANPNLPIKNLKHLILGHFYVIIPVD